MPAPVDRLKVHTVLTVLATDSAGRVVDSMPIRVVTGDDTDSAGNPISPIPAIEDASGVPVRVVAGRMTTNSAGVVVEVVPITLP